MQDRLQAKPLYFLQFPSQFHMWLALIPLMAKRISMGALIPVEGCRGAVGVRGPLHTDRGVTDLSRKREAGTGYLGPAS